jgi:hypothetical protein
LLQLCPRGSAGGQWCQNQIFSLFSHLKLAEKKGALWHLALALALLVIGHNIGYWLLAIGYWLLAAIAMHWHY